MSAPDAAAPIGFLGEPPGITRGSDGLSRLTSAGGDQAGLRYLPSIRTVPRRPSMTMSPGRWAKPQPAQIGSDEPDQNKHHAEE